MSTQEITKPSLWDRFLGREPQSAKAQGQKGLEVTPQVIVTYRSLGWGYGSYGAMYRQQPAVRTVVDFLARNIAQLNPKVYLRAANSDREEQDSHPLAVLLRNPNPATTRYAHLRDTVADLAIYDRAYWIKAGEGSASAVLRLAPPKLFRETDEATGRTTWRLPNGKTIPRNRLVIFHGYDPEGNGEGVSPLETLRRTLAEEYAATTHREAYWKNAARQSGWIERPLDAPEWSEEARVRFRTDIESTMSGSENAGRIGVLEEGMKWNGTAFSPRESQATEHRKLALEEVCRTFGVPVQLLGGSETKANVESFHRQMYQDVLGPWLRMLEGEIELQLLPDFAGPRARGRYYVEFNLNEKLRGSFEEQANQIVTAVGVPYMTRNEGRARLNLPRIDDEAYDLPIVPLNVSEGGQPAVTVPTEDPGDPALPKRGVPVPKEALVERYKAALREFFARQEASVLSKSPAEGEIWADCVKWDEDLSLELFMMAPFLREKTSDLARVINDITYDGIREAIRLGAEVGDVFTYAKDARADELARDLVEKGADDGN